MLRNPGLDESALGTRAHAGARAAAFVFLLAITARAQACGFEVVHSPTPASGDAGLAALAVVSASDIWAVGSAATASGRRTMILHWNGAGWSQVPSPNGARATNWLTAATAVAANDVWAVGCTEDSTQSDTLVLHWNGSSWSLVPSPNPVLPNSPYPTSNKLFGVAAGAANDAWAVGQSFDFTDSQAMALHWNGTSWAAAAVPSPGNQVVLNGACALGSSDVWAVGDHSILGSQTSLLLHWNGSSWSVVPSPNVGPFLNSFQDIVAIAGNDVWAVGYRLAVFGVQQVWQTAALHWDGVGWSAVATPNFNQRNHYLFGVAASGSADVFAVGLWDTGTQLRTLVEHWDGAQWSLLTSPNAGSYADQLSAVAAVDAHDVFAAGEYFDGFQYATLVERLGGEGQPNSAAATLLVDGAGGGSCPGPHHVDVSGTVQLSFAGPPGMPLLLGLGPANAGAALGCPGILGVGTPPLFLDLLLVSGLAPGSAFHLDAAGSYTQTFLLGGIPLGSVLDFQGAVLQPGGNCGVVLTSAFEATVR